MDEQRVMLTVAIHYVPFLIGIGVESGKQVTPLEGCKVLHHRASGFVGDTVHVFLRKVVEG
jgi:hypothetical protein